MQWKRQYCGCLFTSAIKYDQFCRYNWRIFIILVLFSSIWKVQVQIWKTIHWMPLTLSSIISLPKRCQCLVGCLQNNHRAHYNSLNLSIAPIYSVQTITHNLVLFGYLPYPILLGQMFVNEHEYKYATSSSSVLSIVINETPYYTSSVRRLDWIQSKHHLLSLAETYFRNYR